MQRITVNPDSQLVIAHTRIRGIKTTSVVVREDQTEGAKETERNVTRLVSSTAEHTEAKRLESLVRSAVRKSTLHTPLGNLSDSKRVRTLRAKHEEIMEQVAEHNAAAAHHQLDVSLTVLPIGAALDASACRALCDEVTGQLTAIAGLLLAGDVAGVRLWRARNRNLDALMPELIAQALRHSMTVIAAAQKELSALIKEGVEPAKAGASLDLSQLEVAASLILPSQSEAA